MILKFRFLLTSAALTTATARRNTLAFTRSPSSRMSSTSLSAAILNFETPVSSSESSSKTVHIVGRSSNLKSLPSDLLPSSLSPILWEKIVKGVSPGDSGKSYTTLFLNPETSIPHTLTVHVLPEKISRHNTPLRNHAVSSLLKKAPAPLKDDDVEDKSIDVLVVVEEESHCAALACAIARSFPLYSSKNLRKPPKTETEYNIRFASPTALLTAPGIYKNAEIAANAVRLAGRIVDAPPSEMNVSEFIKEAEGVKERLEGEGHDISMEVIRGEELKEGGYGGLYNVGKAAVDPPALVVLTKTWNEDEDAEVVTLVGKGIVYDTGGLSLKGGAGMCGMKTDCGGAAGLLAGFEAAVTCGMAREGSVGQLTVILCLAENSISAESFRNDDILKFLSGRTCEINNTDAEGRLVLADGVAHATMKCKRMPNLVMDMATLTGAQLVATGKKHAGIVTNCEETETRAVKAGKRSGDLVFPLIYSPELLNGEFDSKVADSKNSVKDRGNAQTSCAAHFIGNNLSDEFYESGGAWLHVDMAGPSFTEGRATGYGVGLVLSLLQCNGFEGDI